RHARLEQRLDAGGRAAVMAAGLERHVHRSPRGLRAGGLERLDLGVCLAGALVPALADDALALRDHAADSRIRVGAGEAPLGEAEGALHGLAVELGGRAHGCPLAPARCSVIAPPPSPPWHRWPRAPAAATAADRGPRRAARGACARAAGSAAPNGRSAAAESPRGTSRHPRS